MEFALLLPVLFLILAGIIELGRAWNIKLAVTDAAREGARYAVVQDPSVPTIKDVENKIKERLALAGIDKPKIKIEPASDFRVTGQTMNIEVSTDFEMPWIGALLNWKGKKGKIKIATTAAMRNE